MTERRKKLITAKEVMDEQGGYRAGSYRGCMIRSSQ